MRNYTRKHILLTEFEALLKELCAAGRPVSLPRVLRAAEEGETLPPKAFAITFDDGFANNATEVNRAVEIARGTDGVKSVKNDIRLKTSQ